MSRAAAKLADRELSAIRPRVLPAIPSARSWRGARLITADAMG
jgi:hypothetical protein